MAQGETAHESLHETLRSATSEVHQRLHAHPALSALQGARLDLGEYRLLLASFYGFYVPLETAAQVEPVRTRRLTADLLALGMATSEVAQLPLCPAIPDLATPPRRLGAQYVIEGSALGGQVLARRLDPLFGSEVREGRSFLIGSGAQTGAAWKRFLARLQAFERERGDVSEAVAGATATFAALERWFSGWRGRVAVGAF